MELRVRGRVGGYDLRVFRDEMVGRIAYALNLSTGIFIVLFDHVISEFRITTSGLWDLRYKSGGRAYS